MNVTELKSIIKTRVIEGYELKTNFSSPDFLVQIGNLIIIAKPICLPTEVKYDFVLDTQFLSSSEIKYEELSMIKDVMEILEVNRKVAISRLKKWTVEEYEEDRKQKEKRSEEMLEALKKAFLKNI